MTQFYIKDLSIHRGPETKPLQIPRRTVLGSQFPLILSARSQLFHSINPEGPLHTKQYYCNRAFIWRQIPHSSTFLSSFPYPCLQETRGGRERSPKEFLTDKTGATCFSKVALHLQDKEDFNGSKHLSNCNNRNLINNNKTLILSYQK